MSSIFTSRDSVLKRFVTLTLVLAFSNGPCSLRYSFGQAQHPENRKQEQSSPQSKTSALAGKAQDSSSSLIEPQEHNKADHTKLEAYGKLPLSFEANTGQVDERVKFLARVQGYNVFLTPTEAVMVFSRPASGNGLRRGEKTLPTKRPPAHEDTVVRLRLVGSNAQPRVVGVDGQQARSNYLLGNDPDKWRTSVPNYGKVEYEGV